MNIVSVDLYNLYTMKILVLPVSFPGKYEAQAMNEIGCHHIDAKYLRLPSTF